MSQPALTEEHLGEPFDLGATTAQARARSAWELFWTRFRHDKAAVGGAVTIIVLIILALAAPLFAKITGHAYQDLFGREMLTEDIGLPKGPNSEFWFGADRSGRDLFVRVMYGARTSLTVAFLATGIATAVGIILGMLAGYAGGKTDTVISRAIEIVLALPVLLFAIGLASVCSFSAGGCIGGILKPGLNLVIGIIAVFTWPTVARVVRGQVLSLREREFVEAARSIGAGPGRIMFVELLPNLVAPIVVYSTLLIPNNILFEAALSFLGVGIPAETPSWGRMLSEAAQGQLFAYAWWMMLFPGVFLLITTLSFNMVGDGLRDALGPSERS